MNDKNHRIYRELNDETKQKISNATRGRTKSEAHRQHLSQSLKKYWQTIPNKPASNHPQSGNTTMDELIGKK